jgi:hypothetical protein
MATFDDDFIQLRTESGIRRYKLAPLGLTWPPPEMIDIGGFKFRLLGHSQITDEERATMTHVCRGAEYEVVVPAVSP